MKKLFKAVACVAIGCALLSTSAFAALTGSVTANQNGTYGVSVSNLGDGESTLLVYKSASVISALPASINASDIVYIDQKTASSGAASYTVDVGNRAQAGDTLYFFAGGTNDSAAVLLGTQTIPAATIAVSSVTLDQATLSLTAGGATATLTATVLPADATDPTVTWTTSDPAVATVANGVVTPVAAGTATITATAGSQSATCAVTVTAASTPSVTLGDVDGNGDIDIDDAIQVINYVYWLPSALDDAADANALADVDSNGDVDIDDAIQIINYVYWLPSSLD